MKKFSFVFIMIVALVLTVSCATKAVETEAPAPAAVGSPYAGEYYVVNTNVEGEESVFENFIVDEAGVLSGNQEGSGLSNFEGTVNADGTFTAQFPRLGGQMTGSFDGAGNVSGEADVRGRKSTFKGSIL